VLAAGLAACDPGLRFMVAGLMAISFAEQIASFAAKTKGQSTTWCAGSVREAGQRLIDRSPIDTGRAKSNWNYSLETPTSAPPRRPMSARSTASRTCRSGPPASSTS
jgi:hypothetical protein